MAARYRLRAELLAHEADVRGVAADSASTRVATASRDSLALVWDVAAGGGAPLSSLRGHDHFVNAVAFMPSGAVVTASSDGTIRAWTVAGDGTAECAAVLKGHEKNVCHVAVVPGDSGRVVSSSWDMTARVWNVASGECLFVLRGHEAAVWAAHALPDGRIVTVGGDKTARVWSADGAQHIVLPSVHSDVVRAIAPGPNAGFVTVSNDSSAVHWAPNAAGGFDPGAHLPNLHDGSFAYTVAGMPAPGGGGRWLFASGGEDNAVRVVHADAGGAELVCVQTIMLPGVVWSVALAPNGDIVAGCSDHVARVFTRDPAAVAADDVLAAFDKAVSERQLSTKVIGGVDVAKLPLAEEALAGPGAKDGENKMVRTAGGSAEVHMWSASDDRWAKVGDVVDNPDGTSTMGGGEVRGKRYDFVFEVELGAGGKKEQLGYNRGENSYAAAQRFIEDNELNQDFLDQIAAFVEQQVPADAMPSDGAGASDPLTGGSRYVPRRGGGDGRLANFGGGGGGGDPLTGGGAYRAGGAARNVPLPPPRRYLPHATGPVTYTVSDQLPKLQSKLAEFNTQLATQMSALALSEDEALVFGTQLMPKLKDKAGGESLVVTDEECAVVDKMLKWPTALSFPVLDMARLVIARPSAGAYFFGKRDGAVLDVVLAHVASPDASAAVLIMGCRFLSNLFGNRVVAASAHARCGEILQAAAGAAKSENRRARETHASLLVNYAVSLLSSNAAPDDRAPVLQTAVALLNGGEKDEEVVFRLSVAMGTLMCGGDDMAAKGLELGAAAAAAAVAPVSARVQQVAHEIATLIASP
jgi:phospholipase A-2-activating protein